MILNFDLCLLFVMTGHKLPFEKLIKMLENLLMVSYIISELDADQAMCMFWCSNDIK